MTETYLQLFQTFSGNIFLCAAVLIASLMAVILIHEMGHYITARYFGVRVDRFSLGFGREIAGFTDKKSMRWSLGWIPLGGYIKIFGDVDPEKPEIWDPQMQIRRPMTAPEIGVAFFSKPVWQRAIIVGAGPAMNFLLTLFILTLLFATKGQVSSYPVVTSVGIKTAGYEAGFRPFDEILEMDGRPVRRFEDVWDYTLDNPGVPYRFKVKRKSGEIVTLTAASRPIEYKDKKGIRRAHGRLGATHIIGIELKDVSSVDGIDVRKTPDKARAALLARMGQEIRIGTTFGTDEEEEEVFLAFLPANTNDKLNDPKSEEYNSVYLSATKEKYYFRHNAPRAVAAAGEQIARGIDEAVKIIGVLLTGGGKQEELAGVATLGAIAGKAFDESLYTFCMFIAILSLQIGFINLLPVPVLDGGYLLFMLYEIMARKPLPERVKDGALYLGLAFLFGIMIIANLNDVFQLTRR